MICGKGDLYPYLENLVQELGIAGQVHFLGYRLDVPEMYCMADCFAFPSIHEGLPFALMEAMESGLPIVCSRIRGNVDLIDDQLGGILCDVHSVQEFRNALWQIRGADNQRMLAHNRKILGHFNLDHTKKEISSILKEILEYNN